MQKENLILTRLKSKGSSSAIVGIYDVEVFSALIRHERSRADRSGRAFSLVVFSLGERASSQAFVKRICDRLRKAIRLIDEIGWLEDGSIGVLLPSTTNEGARLFAQRVTANDMIEVLYRVFTYPEHWANDFKEEHVKKAGENSSGSVPDPFTIVSPTWKRILDITLSLIGLLIFWPVFIITALYIKIVSPGPILFRQMRVGRGGKLFHFIKFRTMRPNDEAEHRKHILERMRTGCSLAKLDEKDPRIIPGGKIIRKLCIDELPQLFNVLKGDMSLVGPRPCLPYEAQEYLIWHRHRFDVLPGMTGLWQVSGKNRLTFAQMIRLDITYCKKMSLFFDLKIILMTIPAIVKMVIESIAKKFHTDVDTGIDSPIAQSSAS